MVERSTTGSTRPIQLARLTNWREAALPCCGMKATGGIFTAQYSANPIDEILEAADASFEEVDSLPARDKLTFTNGFYAYCLPQTSSAFIPEELLPSLRPLPAACPAGRGRKLPSSLIPSSARAVR